MFTQQKSSDIKTVHKTKIQTAATEFTILLDNKYYHASPSFKWQDVGEAPSADVEEVEPFKEKLKKIVLANDIHSYENYITGETAFLEILAYTAAA